MKVLTEPKSGKCGIIVFQQGRYGQIARALAIPTNPQTDAQRSVRNRLTAAARGWAGLTQTIRDAWTAAALNLQSNARLGMSGSLTGNQFYTRVYCNTLLVGGTMPTDPPAIPTFAALPISALVPTWTGGLTFKLELTSTGTPPVNTMLRAAPACSAGRTRSPGVVYLGTLPAPVANAIDITSLYTGRYGVPPEGSKIFTQVNQNIDGIEDLPYGFEAIVPAKT